MPYKVITGYDQFGDPSYGDSTHPQYGNQADYDAASRAWQSDIRDRIRERTGPDAVAGRGENPRTASGGGGRIPNVGGANPTDNPTLAPEAPAMGDMGQVQYGKSQQDFGDNFTNWQAIIQANMPQTKLGYAQNRTVHAPAEFSEKPPSTPAPGPAAHINNPLFDNINRQFQDDYDKKKAAYDAEQSAYAGRKKAFDDEQARQNQGAFTPGAGYNQSEASRFDQTLDTVFGRTNNGPAPTPVSPGGYSGSAQPGGSAPAPAGGGGTPPPNTNAPAAGSGGATTQTPAPRNRNGQSTQ
jgi:hypothetical protein